jgi:hypothetical protein
MYFSARQGIPEQVVNHGENYSNSAKICELNGENFAKWKEISQKEGN